MSARGLGRELPTNLLNQQQGPAINNNGLYKPTVTTIPSFDINRARSLSQSGAAVPNSARSSTSSTSNNSSSVNNNNNNGGQGYISVPLRDNVDPRSPGMDRHHRVDPFRASELGHDVVDVLLNREKEPLANPDYLRTQTEVHEKMRTILIDWFVDVALKFKLRPQTYFLATSIVDRYLSVASVARTQLQLVGITAVWIAAKYEEMWAPTVAECVSITANTYNRDEVMRMERTILAALQFKLTVPTCYMLLARLLDVMEADTQLRNAALFYLEHAVLDYKHLHYLPSQLADSALYLAQLHLRKPDAWSFSLQYYAKAQVEDFRACAQNLLDFTILIASSKYQAIRRKYSSSRYSEIARMPFPEEIPQQ